MSVTGVDMTMSSICRAMGTRSASAKIVFMTSFILGKSDARCERILLAIQSRIHIQLRCDPRGVFPHAELGNSGRRASRPVHFTKKYCGRESQLRSTASDYRT